MQPFHTSLEITECTQSLDQAWDDYVQKHPNSSYCHLSAWKKIFGETYGHSNHYLLAHDGKEVFGVLPMFYIRNLTGKGSLISMPFLDLGEALHIARTLNRNFCQGPYLSRKD